MKRDATIAPYIINYKDQLKVRTESLRRSRVSRLRSSIFSLPEFRDWPDVLVISLVSQSFSDSRDIIWKEPGDLPIDKNASMILNELVIRNQSKGVFLATKEVDEGSVRDALKLSLNSESDIVLRNDLGLMISHELFHLANGLDELLEGIEDALDDLILRAVLLGAEVKSTGWSKDGVSDLGRRNVEKGRLMVNHGSNLFC